MDQLFKTASLRVEDAAEILAIRVKLGAHREKQAVSPLTGALVGGGVGLGGGLLASALSKEKEKRTTRNAILGALMGGGIGGMGAYALNNLSTENSLADSIEKLDAAKERLQTSYPNLDKLTGWLGGDTPPPSPEEQRRILETAGITDPEALSAADAVAAQGGDATKDLPGSGISEGVKKTLDGALGDPSTTASGAALGGASGLAAREAVRRGTNNVNIAKRVTDLGPDQVNALGTGADEAKRMQSLAKQPGARVTGTSVTTRPPTPIGLRDFAKPNVPPRAPAGTTTLTPGRDLRRQMRKNHPIYQPTKKVWGGLGALAGGLGAAYSQGGQPGARPLPTAQGAP